MGKGKKCVPVRLPLLLVPSKHTCNCPLRWLQGEKFFFKEEKKHVSVENANVELQRHVILDTKSAQPPFPFPYFLPMVPQKNPFLEKFPCCMQSKH